MNALTADGIQNRLFAVAEMAVGMVSGSPWCRNENSKRLYSLVSIVSQDNWTYFKLTENLPMPNLLSLTGTKRRFADLALRCKNQAQVARLWNWADHQRNADDFFELLYATCSRYFVGDVLVDSDDDAGTLVMYHRNPRRLN